VTRASPRRRGRRLTAILASLALAGGFAALGAWQLQRLAWKEALIARVDARVHASPVPAPGPESWSRITADADAYRRVRVSGVFENDKETLVQATTELGSGYWVMTPLRTRQGQEILINRGFVPFEEADLGGEPDERPTGLVTVTGLLRVSEPRGGFLRANMPALGRWYSRDVAAIARARGLTDAAPYFIDAEAGANSGGWPRAGLTVVRFANSHLSYALTWFTLAGMSLAWGAWPWLTAHQAKSADPTHAALRPHR
jgi:surfeit locus 1 family protein